MKAPEEYARELAFAFAYSGETKDEAMVRKFAQAMTDARRAALESAAAFVESCPYDEHNEAIAQGIRALVGNGA